VSGHLPLKEALERLDLADVWDMAGNPNGTPCPLRGPCVVKSPFRHDQKGASFSMDRNLKVFKDHGEREHKGNVWRFVELARPDWSKAEIARELIRRAGGDPDAREAGWKPKPKALYKAECDRARDEARARIHAANTERPVVDPAKLRPAPEAIAAGWRRLLDEAATAPALTAVCLERGWPLAWGCALVEMGKMALRREQPCFAVEYGNLLLGVHSRFRPRDGGKAWYYSPSPKRDGLETVAAPFVLGAEDAPVWIVTEGQWDAATAYGLLGGFDEAMDLEARVFGLRGSSGFNNFMALYGRAARDAGARVVLVPDVDRAAAIWTEDDGPRWSQMRRLRHLYGIEAVALKFKPDAQAGGKDLNDFYKARALNSEAFANIINSVLCDGK